MVLICGTLCDIMIRAIAAGRQIRESDLAHNT
jgi:hypothetical protein